MPEQQVAGADRPTALSEFIGQGALKTRLEVALHSARARNDQIDHVLFSGPPGLGKTTLAGVLAAEMGAELHTLHAQAVKLPQQLYPFLMSLQEGDFLFLDEIHRLPAGVAEVLYPIMEDFSLTVSLPEGDDFRRMKISVPRFTLVGATTRPGLLSDPLRDRFGLKLQIDLYTTEELEAVLERSARCTLQVEITAVAKSVIAARSRGTPRLAINLLRRARDLMITEKGTVIDEPVATQACQMEGYDEEGLSSFDRSYMRLLSEGVLGVSVLAARLHEAEDSITNVIEPFLLRKGFVEITRRGRQLTALGQERIEAQDEVA